MYIRNINYIFFLITLKKIFNYTTFINYYYIKFYYNRIKENLQIPKYFLYMLIFIFYDRS